MFSVFIGVAGMAGALSTGVPVHGIPATSAHGASAQVRRAPWPVGEHHGPVRVHGKLPAGMYTLVDYGPPPAKFTYNGTSYPEAFNNTGQIAGFGQIANKSGGDDCIAYTGTGWVDYTPLTSGLCDAYAVGDASNGVVPVAGRINGNYEIGDRIAYYATISASKTTINQYQSNFPSGLYAINKFGVAVGNGVYVPYPSSENSDLAFYSLGGGLNPVAPCMSNAPLCPVSIDPRAPGYGGNLVRLINNANTVLAADASNGNLEEVTGKAHTEVDLPVNGATLPCFAPLGIDDAGNLYYQACPASGGQYVYEYNVASQTTTQLPTIPGNSSEVYVPWTVNGKGEIYGNTQSCPQNDCTMFLYDPAAKQTINLSATPSGGQL